MRLTFWSSEVADVFHFLESELSKFSDKGIYDRELRDNCFKLNKLLNNVEIQDYDKHLKKNDFDIQKELKKIAASINEVLFIDLTQIVGIMYDSQLNPEIEKRDHYYHSIQCFLLAIALFDKFLKNRKKPNDVIAILYSLTMYHDIGYLYRKLKTTDNKDILDFFCCNNCFHAHDMCELLCFPKEIRTLESMKSIVNEIKNSEYIKNIWELRSIEGQEKLEDMIERPLFDTIDKEGHAYNSALFLAKAYKTKKCVIDFHRSTNNDIIIDKKEEWFNEIMKAVCLHGLKSLFPPKDLYDDFYSVYLMIIDELQTYGRRLSGDTKNMLINPKDVSFDWHKQYSDKLVIDTVKNNTVLKKQCAAHSYIEVCSKLSKKITKKSLSNIWDPVSL
jgi:hypothetical protein